MAKLVSTEDVQELLTRGAQVVDVLPAPKFADEHIPGSINIPLAELADAADRLDRDKPVVVLCFDHQCDLSARAAARLETLGFGEVYDYKLSKVAWFADGLPSEGHVNDARRAVSHVRSDVPRVGLGATLADVGKVAGDWEIVVVTDDDGVVLGEIRTEAGATAPDTPVAAVMQPAPPTVRPSIPLRELAESMDKHGETHLLVTKHDGTLLGLVRRHELDGA